MIAMTRKYLDEMKCGKLWLRARFKFLVPDLIMMLQHIGGLPLEGSLEADEFFAKSADGFYNGEYLIERNPHICKSEHVILRAVAPEESVEYCGHLENVCMVNCKSVTAQRMNGADYDKFCRPAQQCVGEKLVNASKSGVGHYPANGGTVTGIC